MTQPSYRSATVSLHYLNNIQQTLIKSGFSSALLDEYLCGVAEDDYYFTRVSIEQLLAIWQQVEDICSDAVIGLQVGKALHPMDLGLLGQLVMNCQTVADALLNMYGIEFIVNNLFPTQAILQHGQAINRLQCQHYDAESIRHIVEQDIAGIISLGPFLFNQDYDEKSRPLVVHFRHSAHADQAIYEDVLGCKVHFNQDYNQIIFPATVLATPIYGSCNRAFKALKQEVNKLVLEIEKNETWVLRLWRYFKTIKHSQDISIEDCAQTFNMTSRTLQRNLKAEQTSFQQELFNYKTDQAKRLLADGQRTLKNIASELGFSDSSSFHKAFKRWSGMSPKEYRESLKKAASVRP